VKKLEKILSEVLEIRAGKINDGTSPQNAKSWDSFRGLLLVTELEKNYKVRFSMDDVISVRNVGDIKRSLKKYGVKFDE